MKQNNILQLISLACSVSAWVLIVVLFVHFGISELVKFAEGYGGL